MDNTHILSLMAVSYIFLVFNTFHLASFLPGTPMALKFFPRQSTTLTSFLREYNLSLSYCTHPSLTRALGIFFSTPTYYVFAQQAGLYGDLYSVIVSEVSWADLWHGVCCWCPRFLPLLAWLLNCITALSHKNNIYILPINICMCLWKKPHHHHPLLASWYGYSL